jgi:GDP/UDP-N,N'-diacetylbacillosamine 2-epimerase (hydrolysing)
MKIVVLTSSRADYSIYLPLLKKLKNDEFFELSIVAFGMHLSEKFGKTIKQIQSDGFEEIDEIETLPSGDSPFGISESIGKTMLSFTKYWEKIKTKVDLIFCLGDRYEMFAAVSATIPFALPVAHIHGGETTLGAIDNIYRHSLTHIAKLHFASTLNHSKRIIELKSDDRNVYNVGALSLDNLKTITLLTNKQFLEKFNIPINNPVLVTFHPETVSFEKNEAYINELVKVLSQLKDQIIITMPNADTNSQVIRNELLIFSERRDNVYCVESLGTLGYFSCLSLCKFVLGNSSSGIIEAASFGKYVINIGERQKGRESDINVIHTTIDAEKILNIISQIETLPVLSNYNIYGDGQTADRIIEILKSKVID